MALGDLPDILKHMTLAIMKNTGNSMPGFLKAFQIARDKLVRDGYLTPGSNKGDTNLIQLTSKGAKQNRVHTSEGASKSKKFDQFFRKTELETASGSKDDKSARLPGSEEKS